MKFYSVLCPSNHVLHTHPHTYTHTHLLRCFLSCTLTRISVTMNESTSRLLIIQWMGTDSSYTATPSNNHDTCATPSPVPIYLFLLPSHCTRLHILTKIEVRARIGLIVRLDQGELPTAASGCGRKNWHRVVKQREVKLQHTHTHIHATHTQTHIHTQTHTFTWPIIGKGHIMHGLFSSLASEWLLFLW